MLNDFYLGAPHKAESRTWDFLGSRDKALPNAYKCSLAFFNSTQSHTIKVCYFSSALLAVAVQQVVNLDFLKCLFTLLWYFRKQWVI